MITISPGGGAGVKIGVGYFLLPLLDANLEIGMQNSALSKKVENAEGCFSRSFILGTLRYALPVSGRSSINIGGGAGFYQGGKMDLDLQEVPGGEHLILKYKNTTGFHVLAEYEYCFPRWTLWNASWSCSAGLKYYGITYDLDSISINGMSVSGGLIPHEVKKEFTPLDGSGFDVLFSMIMRL
ncbi:MAG TPA: hypothetical protein ENN17_01640 [bacterium]|nr:hypothetical protein [bacterium]